MDQSVEPFYEADTEIDITRDLCPMTYVRVRLALDRMQAGAVLLVTLKGDEPRRNVPRSAAEQGHVVLAQQDSAGEISRFWIRKG